MNFITWALGFPLLPRIYPRASNIDPAKAPLSPPTKNDKIRKIPTPYLGIMNPQKLILSEEESVEVPSVLVTSAITTPFTTFTISVCNL